MRFNNRNSMICSLLASIALTSALGGVALPVVAADTAPSMTVKFADLDVSHTAGAEQLYARIRGAAGKLCVAHDNEALGNKRVWDACFKDAVTQAVKQINRPALTAVYRAKIGDAVQPLVASNN